MLLINFSIVFETVSFCLVLLQIPKCFVQVQMFCASPKIWLHLVPLQNLLCWHKNQFYWIQIIFLPGTKCLWLPYVNKFLVWHKKFGPAQNILGPVKGQGICCFLFILLFSQHFIFYWKSVNHYLQYFFQDNVIQIFVVTRNVSKKKTFDSFLRIYWKTISNGIH